MLRDSERKPVEAAARAEKLARRRDPLQARAHEKVTRILGAAVELLEEGDTEAITTAAIARRAAVPIGSVYHYFPNREAILAELAARKFREVDGAFVTGMRESLERLPWREAVELALDASVAAFRSDPAYVAVWRAMRSSPVFRSVATASDERFARNLASLAIVARLPAARGRALMRSAIRIANAFLDWALETPDPRDAAACVREMKRAVVAYLAAELDAVARRSARPARTQRARR
jgi:AcrR family transcriptional regulator